MARLLGVHLEAPIPLWEEASACFDGPREGGVGPAGGMHSRQPQKKRKSWKCHVGAGKLRLVDTWAWG